MASPAESLAAAAGMEAEHDRREFVGASSGSCSHARHELKAISALAWPLAVSTAAGTIQSLSNALLLGHYETAALAAVSVSSIWTSLTDVILFSGLGQLSTLCSQAYGAGNLPLLGIWLQMFLVFIAIAAVPVACLRWCTADILKFVGVPADVADLAGIYTIWSQLAFVFDLWFYAFKEFFAAQNNTRPAAIVDCLFLVVNLAAGYMIVFVFRLGIVGVAIGTSVVRLVRTVLYVLYCRHMGYHKRAWHGWSCAEIFIWERWRKLLGMVFPAALGGFAEELQFEVCTILAARMGGVESAAFNLALNFLMVTLLIGMSLGEATGIRMAHFLGALRPSAARFVSRVGIAVTSVWCIALGILMALGVKYCVHFASNDVAVQNELRRLQWTFTLAVMLMGIFISLAIVLTKQGRAGIVGTIIPLTCWGAGFPVSIILSHSQGLLGIICGLILGYSLATASLTAFYLCSDWPALAEKAQHTAENSSCEASAGEESRTVSMQPLA